MHMEYARLHKWLDNLPIGDEYRVKLRGLESIIDAPTDYYLTVLEQKLGIAAFNELSIDDKARHIAVARLSNMQEMIDTHSLHQYRERRSSSKDGNSASKTQIPKRASPAARARSPKASYRGRQRAR